MYTYDDVLKKISDTGISLSDSDLKYAATNPDAAMSIISAKQNYASASTDADRAYWHGIAESARSQGGYSGGGAGSDYISLGTPASYAPAAETPTYENQYAEQIQSALAGIQNKSPWSYNAESDQAYQAARKQYLREGERSTADTLGQYAAATGGMPSTAATTAASQAGDYYKTQLSDQLGNYISADYQRYIDQLGAQYDELSALSSLEQGDYAKYQDQLAQYNTQQAFDYQQYLDNITANTEAAQTEYEKIQYEKEYADAKTQNSIDYCLSLYDATGDATYLARAKQLISTYTG